MVIAGGGTGGHLYPGLAVARALQGLEPECAITFAGTARGLEARVVPGEGFELDAIRSAGLKGKSARALLAGLLLLPASAIDAWRLLSRRRPHVVVGVGGYSSGPVVLCAVLRRIRTLVLEQNVVPGFTNRALARLVDAAAVTFEATRAYFGERAFVSGNPVRASFLDAPIDEGEQAPCLLVFGGSQGARAINAAVVDALPALAARWPGLTVVHQTGAADFERVRAAHAATPLASRVEPFMTDLDREMRRASLVVCRAGATTLAEIAAAGRPAILVPLPTATDDHQRRNALALVEAGAAELVEQDALSGAVLADAVDRLLADADRRRRMSEAVRRFARPEAALRVARRVIELAQGRA